MLEYISSHPDGIFRERSFFKRVTYTFVIISSEKKQVHIKSTFGQTAYIHVFFKL
jgi:hypothetical protein